MARTFISLEDESSLKKEVEQEVVLYCKMSNPQGLSQAYDSEWHEQAEIKTDAGRIRIRKTTSKDGAVSYELTTKHQVNHGGVIEMQEITSAITPEIYNQFFSVSEKYMSKQRYKFRVEKIILTKGDNEQVVEARDMNYEVDVFQKADGSTSPWVKIDVEVQNLIPQLKEANLDPGQFKLNVRIGKLPFGPTDVVFDNRDGDPDRAALVRQLYDSEFLISRVEKKEQEPAAAPAPEQEPAAIDPDKTQDGSTE